MSTTTQLLIHAGMRPGEIIVARADGSDPVFVPPTDIIHGFTIGRNPGTEEWALLRHYCGQRAPDALLSFNSSKDAEQALSELHLALLEPAPASVVQESTLPKPVHLMAIAGVLAIGIAMLFVFRGNKEEAPTPAPIAQEATISAPQATPGTVIQPTSSIDNVPNMSAADVALFDLPIPPSQTQEATPPQQVPAVSPGDSLLQQIRQGSPQVEAKPEDEPQAKSPPPAASSPGTSLLNQIKGN